MIGAPKQLEAGCKAEDGRGEVGECTSVGRGVDRRISHNVGGGYFGGS